MKLSTAIRRFDDQMRADGKAQLTREAYLRDLRLLSNWIGGKTTIEKIAPRTLTQFINSKTFSRTQAGRPKATISLNRSKSSIRVFFQFLVDAGYLKQNPARLVRLARTRPKPPRPMSQAEVKKLLSTIRKHKNPLAQRDHVIFSLMLGTGIRLGSLVRLSVEDVNLTAGTLSIRAKGGVEQSVYLNPALKKQLRRHVKGLDDSSTALFCSRSGRRLQARQVQLRFGKWLKEAGVKKHTVHSLRHTFGTMLYRQTSDIYLVQKLLGHSSPATTQRYAQITDRDLRAAVRKCV